MMIHIADLFPEAGFAPALGSPERAQFLRWQVYLATTVYMSELRLFYPDRYTADPAGAEAVKARATRPLVRQLTACRSASRLPCRGRVGGAGGQEQEQEDSIAAACGRHACQS